MIKKTDFMLLLFLMLVSLTGCGISDEDREEINALVDIYHKTRNTRDEKSLEYLLSPKWDDREKHIEQFKLQTQYFSDVRFFENWRRIEDSPLSFSSVDMKISYNIIYIAPEQRVPVMKYNCLKELSFSKPSKQWKISNIKKHEKNCETVPPSEVQKIFHTLATRTAAMNNADMALFETIVAPDYPLRHKIIENNRKNLELFKIINHSVKIRELVSYNSLKQTVRIRQHYDLVFQLPDQEEPQKMTGKKETLTLKRYEDGWKIKDGLN
ncbi:MAG: hypothetical protein R6W70_06805 [bacterium]